MTERETKIAEMLLEEVEKTTGDANQRKTTVENYHTFMAACSLRPPVPGAPVRPVVVAPSRAGAKGRQVLVQNIDEGSPFAGAIERSTIYPSASEASRAVGCAHNALHLALKVAAAKGGDNANVAVVKGVHFQYVDTIDASI
jgi:hypothetical protein